ncbi:BEIGE/BEACH/WD DOMAIN CONTAINING PROTEIN-RELATED [Salix viminalis]|uniref:BEIGE/BEACH/WD DOMAIN CONTAINING PROTEIN-RELATED n=1 Tax=Salix viminalis TaxID=40686 RepID=A0A9Q0UUS8_SALVM|nr:BEIGE/BEACH/WD DOMAIN CONTAINING PROTEIN-RELATED [Salix viminalis]
MVHCSNQESALSKFTSNLTGGLYLGDNVPEYRLLLHKVLKFHKHPVTSLLLTSDLKQLLSGDSGGHLLSWTLPDESLLASSNQGWNYQQCVMKLYRGKVCWEWRVVKPPGQVEWAIASEVPSPCRCILSNGVQWGKIVDLEYFTLSG